MKCWNLLQRAQRATHLHLMGAAELFDSDSDIGPEDGDLEDDETVPHLEDVETVPHLLSVESIESTMFYAAKYLSKNFHQHSSRCRKRKYGKVICAETRPTDNTQG